jgi:hypothetical protein
MANKISSSAAASVRYPLFARPMVGQVLTVIAALALYFVFMILSLVGPAGQAAPHARANLIAFTCVLLVAIGLAVVALQSKLMRRKLDGSPLPRVSMILLGIGLFLLLALVTGLLKS